MGVDSSDLISFISSVDCTFVVCPHVSVSDFTKIFYFLNFCYLHLFHFLFVCSLANVCDHV